MTESIPPILKKEYACHRLHMSKTEECFAKQLESSVTAEHILKDLNNLEEKVPFAIYLGILISLFSAFGLWLMDVVSDGFLTRQYYQDFMNAKNQIVQECKFDKSVDSISFNESETYLYCDVGADCVSNTMSSKQRFYWTLVFVLLPFVLNFQEYLTLTDGYEITNTRKTLSNSFKDLKANKCNRKTLPILLKTSAYICFCFIVIILWTPITALYQWVCGSNMKLLLEEKKWRLGKKKGDVT